MADSYDLKFKLKKVVHDDPRSKKWFLRNYFKKDSETSKVELVLDKEDKGLKIDLRCPNSFNCQDISMQPLESTYVYYSGLLRPCAPGAHQ